MDKRDTGGDPLEELSNPGEAPSDHAAAAPRPSHSEDGVDLTLIRWMLSLTPGERLEAVQNMIRSILRLRDVRSRS